MTQVTIVIPAHNEAGYIQICLSSVLSQSYQGPLRVIIASNGSTDATVAETEALAPDFAAKGWQLQILDLPKGGKIGALNHADALIDTGIRIYLDADIQMGPMLLAELVRVLDVDAARYAGGKLVVAPARSALSRAYARFWQKLPFVANGVTGAGLFAVNEAGRKRWDTFPAIISDDTFARLQFEEDERVLADQPYTWPIAEGFRTLVRVRRRQDDGVHEIAEKFPQILARQGHTRPTRGQILRLAAADPIGFAAYSAVALAVKSGRNQQDWARGR